MSNVNSAIYYFDPTATSGTGVGTYTNPFYTVNQFNDKSFLIGDDVYFKVGTITHLLSGERFNIDWDGSESNPAVIGAYYGENQFGLNGGERPIISGLVNGVRTGGGLYGGAIQYLKMNAIGYVHIKDLHITGVTGSGVTMSGRDAIGGEGSSIEYCRIENVKTTNTASMGLGLYYSFHGLIQDCIVEDSNQRIRSEDPTSPYVTGDGIDINAMQHEGRSKYNTVRGCTVARAYEGIGVYQGPVYTTIENNTVYDCRTYHIYVSNSEKAVIRNNLIYSTLESRAIPIDGSGGSGIVHDAEGHNPNVKIHLLGGLEIYGNKIAGMSGGIKLVDNSYHLGVYQKNNHIYNNRIVDCDKNFVFNHDQYGGWENNLIEDNYLFIFTEGLVHTSKMSPLGITWDQNHYNTDVISVSGNAAVNAFYNNPSLIKTTGWRSLIPGSVTQEDFLFMGEMTQDVIPPVRSNGIPTGTLSSGTTQTIISLTTNEAATCRYSMTANTMYSSMANTFVAIGGTAHSRTITGLTDGNSYNYYVKCIDSSNNTNINDYVINFVVGTLQTKSYEVKKTNSPLIIDGNLNEFVDANVITIDDSVNGLTGSYKLLWDNDAIYVGAKVSDSQLNSQVAVRDQTGIWHDDAIEIFFDVLNDEGDIDSDDYKFFVNLLNVQSDARGVSNSLGFDTTWNSVFSSAVVTSGTLNSEGNSDVEYIIEIKIPWDVFERGALNAGTTLGFDLGLRNMNDLKESNYVLWSNSDGGGTNNPSGWGKIVFSSEAVGRFCSSGADVNGDSFVSVSEIGDFIFMWKEGSVSINELMKGIGEWRGGC
jgi:hypothetical protein